MQNILKSFVTNLLLTEMLFSLGKTCQKIPRNLTFYRFLLTLIISLIAEYQERIKFQVSFVLHGLQKETKNVIQFMYTCTISSPTDGRNTNEWNEMQPNIVCKFKQTCNFL